MEALPIPTPPINDLIRSISEMEECLAKSRNNLRRRIRQEPLTRELSAALTSLSIVGDQRARIALKRYRDIEGGLRYSGVGFDEKNSLDWRNAADAALRLAMSKFESPAEAIATLKPTELESFWRLMRHARRLHNKGNPAAIPGGAQQ